MSYCVGVVGATGAVGTEMLEILAARRFPISELILFASSRSIGKEIIFKNKKIQCRALTPELISECDIIFFDASDEVSAQWVPIASESGAWVVDNSASFRMKPEIPLLVPEVNGAQWIQSLKEKATLTPQDRVVSGPNCTTVQLVMSLKPILDQWGLERLIVSTYQSTSGAGLLAMEELKKQNKDILSGVKPTAKVFPYPIAFNCIPQIGRFKENGYSTEELKLIEETKKILSLPNLKVTATAVRVPTLSCHAESVYIETEKKSSLEDVRKKWENFPGLKVTDEPTQLTYPMGIEASGQDYVSVGRLRKDLSIENGLNFWVVSDNVRKGAALNAIQIGEMLIENKLL